MQWWHGYDEILERFIKEGERKVCLPKKGVPGGLIPWKKWNDWTKRMKRIWYKLGCNNNGAGSDFGRGLEHCGGMWGRCKIDS